jgi:hypothetical protein
LRSSKKKFIEMDLIPCRGTQNASPLVSWGIGKGRFGQPGADGAAFLFEV